VSLKKLLLVISAGWAICVLVTLGVRTLAAAAPITPSEYFAWVFLAGGPAVVAALVIRGSLPNSSMAQVLYDAERADSAALEGIRARLRAIKDDAPRARP
jgi:hypothetical protein